MKQNPYIYKSLNWDSLLTKAYLLHLVHPASPKVERPAEYFEYIKSLYSLFTPQGVKENPSWFVYVNAIRHLDRLLCQGDIEGAIELIRRLMFGLQGKLRIDIVSWHLYNLLKSLLERLRANIMIKAVRISKRPKRRLKKISKIKPRRKTKIKLKPRKPKRKKVIKLKGRTRKFFRGFMKAYLKLKGKKREELIEKLKEKIDDLRWKGRIARDKAERIMDTLETIERGEFEYIRF